MTALLLALVGALVVYRAAAAGRGRARRDKPLPPRRDADAPIPPGYREGLPESLPDPFPGEPAHREEFPGYEWDGLLFPADGRIADGSKNFRKRRTP